MIKSVYIKENDGGGITIEYYKEGKIEVVITGLEYYDDPDPYDDLIGLLTGSWQSKDRSMWYDKRGNYLGDKNEGRELTALDVVDYDESTNILAYAKSEDEEIKKIDIYPLVMGNAGKKYFKLL